MSCILGKKISSRDLYGCGGWKSRIVMVVLDECCDVIDGVTRSSHKILFW